MAERERERERERPPGALVAVFSSEREAQVAVARRWAGPEHFVTVVDRGLYTWAVYVDTCELSDLR